MEKALFTPTEFENQVFDRYIKMWPEWPKSAPATDEERIADLEDFTSAQEELIYELFSQIEELKNEIRQLKNGK